MNKKELIKIFKEYVSNFDMLDEAIKRKYYHSLRVMDISINIAKSLKLNKEDIYIAGIIGLLHDYGRFTQWNEYHTYNDLISIDHGDLAVKLLFDDKEIEKYNIDRKYYGVIHDSIKYHNKLEIPSNLSKKSKLFSKIIRDADKIDIMYILGMDTYFLKEDNYEISKDLKLEYYDNKLLSREKIKSNNDNILLHLSMVYDLNYNYSYKFINENKLIDKIFNNITQKEIFKEYFNYIIKFIDERKD